MRFTWVAASSAFSLFITTAAFAHTAKPQPTHDRAMLPKMAEIMVRDVDAIILNEPGGEAEFQEVIDENLQRGRIGFTQAMTAQDGSFIGKVAIQRAKHNGEGYEETESLGFQKLDPFVAYMERVSASFGPWLVELEDGSFVAGSPHKIIVDLSGKKARFRMAIDVLELNAPAANQTRANAWHRTMEIPLEDLRSRVYRQPLDLYSTQSTLPFTVNAENGLVIPVNLLGFEWTTPGGQSTGMEEYLKGQDQPTYSALFTLKGVEGEAGEQVYKVPIKLLQISRAEAPTYKGDVKKWLNRFKSKMHEGVLESIPHPATCAAVIASQPDTAVISDLTTKAGGSESALDPKS